MKTLLACLILASCCCLSSAQSSEKVLYSFGSGPFDGVSPSGGLAYDAAGNLYGTTFLGGKYCYNGNDVGCGTVFELSRGVGGIWTETKLYDFCSTGDPFTCLDGSLPEGGLIRDATGNLYGTTLEGGTGAYGVVFRLSPPSGGNGSWTETVLWNFAPKDKNNGWDALYGKLNMDADGDLYGTTSDGGTYNVGIVFELSPSGGGSYAFSILHSFAGPEGSDPQYGVAIDKNGNLYGTAEHGGMDSPNCNGGCGTVYELSPSDGTWKVTGLYKFNGTSGAYPISPISIDHDGNLYGTVAAGGMNGPCDFGGCGGVFKLVPRLGGGGTKYTFLFSGYDGGFPMAGVLIDPQDDSLVGVSSAGYGDVYQILKNGNETVLYTFCSLPGCVDGESPGTGDIMLNGNGAFYGTTEGGGAHDGGVVFSLTK